jgi:UDP-glucose:glycoprotein glucosyltransferase
MYPGQLPSVRRDIHNAIVPIDFTSAPDVSSVVETIMSLIKRGIPLRWGLVPQTLSEGALEQAMVVYYLKDAYGLSAVINYLQAVGDSHIALKSQLTLASSLSKA